MSNYSSIILNRSVQLSWVYPQTTDYVVTDFIDVRVIAHNLSIILPSALNSATGASMQFNNVSVEDISFDLTDVGGDILISINPGEAVEVYLANTSTTNGLWRIVSLGEGSSSITGFTAISSDNSIEITGGDVTPPTGTIDFTLPTNISAIQDLAVSGYIAATIVSDTITYLTNVISGGLNISVDDGNGQTGTTTINLGTELNNLVSIQVGDISMTGTLISSTGDLDLSSANGSVFINVGVIVNDEGLLTALNGATISGNLQCSDFIASDSIQVGGLIELSGNTIETLTAGDLILTAGDGALILNGVNIDDSANITSVANLTVLGTLFVSTISNLYTLNVGSLTLINNTITNPTTNGSIILQTLGSGRININTVSIDTSGNVYNINNLNTVGNIDIRGTLSVGNLTFISNTIANPTNGGSIILQTLGSGKVNINTVSVDANGNIAGINNLNISGTLTAANGTITSATIGGIIIATHSIQNDSSINIAATDNVTINGIVFNGTGDISGISTLSIETLSASNIGTTTLSVGSIGMLNNTITNPTSGGNLILQTLGSGRININTVSIDTSGNVYNINNLNTVGNIDIRGTLSVGNLTFISNTIANPTNGGSIILQTLGSGKVNINTVSVDANGNIAGINNLNISGTLTAANGTITSATIGGIIIATHSIQNDSSINIAATDNVTINGIVFNGTGDISGISTLSIETLTSTNIISSTISTNSIDVGYLHLTNNIITSTNSEDIVLNPSGSGNILLNSISIDQNNNISSINTLTGTTVKSSVLLAGSIEILNSTITNPTTNGGLTIQTLGTGKINLNGMLVDTSRNLTNVGNINISGLLSVGALTFISNTIANPTSGSNLILQTLGSGKININGVLVDTSSSVSATSITTNALTAGNLHLSSNTISSTTSDGGVHLISLETGVIGLNGAQVDTSSNLTGVHNIGMTGSLTGSASIAVGAITLISNTISNPTTGSNLILQTLGTGKINLNSVLIDTSSNLTGVSNIGMTGGLTGATSIAVGAITLINNTIANPTTGSDLILQTLGSGKINLNGAKVDTSDNLTGIHNIGMTGSLTGATSIAVGAITLISNTIANLTSGNNLILQTLGTGKINLNNMLIDTSANVQGINDLSVGGDLTVEGNIIANGTTFVSPGIAIGWCTFTDNLTSITILESSNYGLLSLSSGTTITGGGGVYTVTFSSTSLTNYMVLANVLSGTPTSPLPSIAKVASIPQPTSFIISTTDNFGNPLPATAGVAVIIYSATS